MLKLLNKAVKLQAITVFTLALMVGCQEDKKNPKVTSNPTVNPYAYGDQSGGYQQYDVITITSSAGDMLQVSLNNTVTWTFTATSSNMSYPPTIQSITPSTIVEGMSINLSSQSVTFTPRKAEDLTGKLTVTAVSTSPTGGSSPQTREFIWVSDGTSNQPSIFGQLFAAVLPDLLGGLIGGTGNKLGTLLGGILSGGGNLNNGLNLLGTVSQPTTNPNSTSTTTTTKPPAAQPQADSTK